MSYTRQGFEDGQVLNAAKLVLMEDAIIEAECNASDALDKMNEYSGAVVSVSVSGNKITVTYVDQTTDEYTLPSGEGGLAFDGGYQDSDGYLHLTLEGEDIEGFEPILISGGGSGSSSDSTLKLKNSTGSSSFTVLDTAATAPIAFNVTSVDSDDDPTGNITCYWSVGGVRKATVIVEQGDNTFDVFQYLTTGATNTVKLTVEDTYGATKSMTWYVTVSAFGLTWNVDEMAVYSTSDSLALRLIPTGDGTKTVYVSVDGVQIAAETVATTGRTLAVTVPAQTHGAHIIKAWMTATVNGSEVTTEELTHAGLWVNSDASTPIVAILESAITASQYATVGVKYMVYDPSNETSMAYLYEGDTLKSSVTVGRTVQTWAYRVTTVGATTLRITCGSASATCTVTGTDSSVDVNPVTAGLVLDLDPTGHTNTEAGYANFGYTDGSGTKHPLAFSENFDWENGGFQLDADGVTAFVVKRGTYVDLDRSLFSDEAGTNGKEIKIVFKSTNVLDYDAELMQSKSGNVGLVLGAQIATLSSQLSSISIPYCEGKKIEMDVNIHSKNDGLYAVIWLEGVPSRVVSYASSDSWQQTVTSNMRIGSDDCDVWLYRMKMYENSLSRFEILDNFIADCADAEEMVDRAERNDIFSTTGDIDRAALATANPDIRVIHITAARMTTSKEDSLSCDIEHVYVNGDSGDNWTATGAKFKAQGTSSLQYGLSALNLDIDLSSATEWIDADGNAMTSYGMTADSIPVAYFNLKANVASSENANNVCLADDYNTFNPCKAPGYSDDTRIRDTVEGHPCAVFFTNNSSAAITVGARTVAAGETILYFCGDMNNSKKNTAVFGQDSTTYPMQCCIEITNNNNGPCRFKSEIQSTELFDGDGDFEPRYPKTLSEEQIAAFKEMHSWVVSTDQTAATSAVLDSPVVYDGTTYTVDNAAYRAAKFKAEVENYFDLDSLLFHYLFTERHLMVDNRAKNTFVSYEPNSDGDYRWNFRCDYDNDTADGNDNSGGLTFSYGMEDIDTVGSADVFNAADSVLWCNIRDCMYDELCDMYVSRESLGAWSASRFVAKMSEYKAVRPEAAVIEDQYNKYILPYLNSGSTTYIGMCYGNKDDQLLQFETYQEPYIASKYGGSLATSDSINLRANGSSENCSMEIIPYSDLYVTVHYGNAGTVRVRAQRGVAAEITCPADNLNDLETSVWSASRLSDIGDISSLHTKLLELTTATKLTALRLGSGESGYQNTNMTAASGGVSFGSNILLRLIDLRGLINLTSAMDLSALTNLEEFYASGSGITGVTFPTGGALTTIDLPAVTQLTARGLTKVESFAMDATALQVVWIEDCDGIDTQSIVESATGIVRGRLTGVAWNMETADAVTRLIGTAGMDATGTTSGTFVLTGTLHLTTVTNEELAALVTAFPDLTITYDNLVNSYTVTFANYDGTVLNTQTVREGADAVNPVTAGYISAPTKPSTVEYKYTWSGWDTAFTSVTQDITVTATFSQSYMIYTVNWYNGTTLLYTQSVQYGETATYSGDDPTPATGKIWAGWDQTTISVSANMNVYAVFVGLIEDMSTVAVPTTYDYLCSDDSSDNCAYTKEEFYSILYYAAQGTLDASSYFAVGDKIKIVATISSYVDEYLICRLEGFNHNKLSDGSGKFAPTIWSSIGLLNTNQKMNGSNTNSGGWASCAMRTFLNDTFFPKLPVFWKNIIKQVKVLSSTGSGSSTISSSDDYLFLLSQAEVGFNTSDVPYVNEVDADADNVALAYYTDNSKRIKKYYNGTGSAAYWWLRSPVSSSSSNFCYVYATGGGGSNGASPAYGVSFGFCI